MSWHLPIPEDAVPDSARGELSVIGDVMGPSLEVKWLSLLKKLIKMSNHGVLQMQTIQIIKKAVETPEISKLCNWLDVYMSKQLHTFAIFSFNYTNLLLLFIFLLIKDFLNFSEFRWSCPTSNGLRRAKHDFVRPQHFGSQLPQLDRLYQSNPEEKCDF